MYLEYIIHFNVYFSKSNYILHRKMYKNLFEKMAGAVVFLTALTTYGLTVEPTNSFWDCGEYIATAYKLQVGHPPGAPLFLLLGNFLLQS